jgi:hypothetical protein
MHRSRRNKRVSTAETEGTLFVNPALVPRVFPTEQGMSRHHMVLELNENKVAARDVYVE